MARRRREVRPGASTPPPRGLETREVVVAGHRLRLLSFPIEAGSADDASVSACALTAAERDVLALVLAGESNRSIAALRSVSYRTVANQVASIFRKLGVGSRRGLLARLPRK